LIFVVYGPIFVNFCKGRKKAPSISTEGRGKVEDNGEELHNIIKDE
jgi:hypothetical protein